MFFRIHRIVSGLAIVVLLAEAVSSQTKPDTVEKAFELSRATGRPIFVMAGRET